MKKTFLLFLMTLLCCVTGVWAASVTATSGSGQQDDPYIYEVSSDDVVELLAGDYGEFHFTVPEEGGVLFITSESWDDSYSAGFEYKKSTDAEWTSSPLFDTFAAYPGVELEGGVTYYIRNTVPVSKSERMDNLTFAFTPNEVGGEDPGDEPDKGIAPSSGSGKQSDPYVYEVSNGTIVTVKADEYLRCELTYDGTGELIIKSDGWLDSEWMTSFRYKAEDDTEWKTIDLDNSEYFSMTLTLNGFEAGKKYVFENQQASYEEKQNITFTFTGAGEGGGDDDPSTGDPDEAITVEDGSTYTIPAGGQVYAEIVIPEGKGGTLKLFQSSFNGLGMGVKEKGSAGEFEVGPFKSDGTGMYTTFRLEGGKTYVILNTIAVPDFLTDGITITVDYLADADNENAFTVVSTKPDFIGKEFAGVKEGENFTVTLDKGVAFLEMTINGGEKYGNLTTTYGTPVGEGEPLIGDDGQPVTYIDRNDATGTPQTVMLYKEWEFSPVVGDWTFYSDAEYTLIFTSYANKNDWYDMNSQASTEVKFKGATEPQVFSDIKLLNVTPAPTEDNLDEMLSSKNNTVTFEFDGEVKVESCTIALGAGGSIKVNTVTDYETVPGHTIITATPDVGGKDFNIAIVLKVTDMDGNELQDEEPIVPGVTWFAGQYSIDFSVADGRTIDALLEYDNVSPRLDSYVEKLDKITFTVSNGLASDDGASFYQVTSASEAGIYNEKNEKVYDVALMNVYGFDEETTSPITAAIAEIGSVDYENKNADNEPAYTPAEITEPGVYTLKIGEMSIGDANFEAASPWMTTQGGTKGRCNPDWSMTFNVVEKVVGVEAVDPVPYNVSGEYNEKVPAEITVNFDDEDVTVNNVIISSGSPIAQPVDGWKLDGKTLTIPVSEELQASRTITVKVTATASTGQIVNYGYTDEELNDGNNGIMLVYQTPQDALVPTEVTPADKATVESISDIVLTFDENLGTVNSEGIELRDADDNVVASGVAEINFDEATWSATSLTISLDNVITAAGTYTLVIPAENFYNEDETLWNPELKYTFTIETLSGISGIKVNADGTVKVYTIDGVYVGEGQVAEVLGKLAKGIYIVNGTKVAIK